MTTAAGKICRKRSRELYFAAFVLPREKREGIYAIDAFVHMIRDAITETTCADVLGPLRDTIDAIYAGHLELPQPEFRSADQQILADVSETIRRFQIPKACLIDLVDGCVNDLKVSRFATYKRLEARCEALSGTVARMHACVVGLTHSDAHRGATALGNAIELVRILCGIDEWIRRGKVLLPQEDLVRFGYGERELSNGVFDDRLGNLMRFEVERARRLLEQATLALPWLGGKGPRLFGAIMIAGQFGLLDAMERRRFNPFGEAVVLSGWDKLRCFGRAWKLARQASENSVKHALV